MPRNEHFLPRNNGNRSESIPRNFFGTKLRSQLFRRHFHAIQDLKPGLSDGFAVQLLAYKSLSFYYFYVPEAYIMYMMSLLHVLRLLNEEYVKFNQFIFQRFGTDTGITISMYLLFI
jgi:hypothetical protein